ncbi:hypothetical protein FRB94_009405 [Tulasnella sp. JGI-2019a]|nr:hypothetical protein FRB94_009405 [Tulasnella sp. JGI-2019a]
MESQSSTTGLKRKASFEGLQQTDSKKAKDQRGDTSGPAAQEAASSKQPTNVTLPVNITFPSPTPDTVKIASWNVAGLRASLKKVCTFVDGMALILTPFVPGRRYKGFKFYVEAEDPDILILTETKINDVPMEPVLDSRYPHRYWNIAKQKGYAGTAAFSKHKPISVGYVLPDIKTPDIVKGRLVILEFESCWVVGTYVPNAGQKLKSMDAKVEWQRAFQLHMQHLDSQKPVIWTGDQNVAHTPLDLTNSKSNWDKTPGHTAIECEWFRDFLKGPESTSNEDTTSFVDVWRRMNPKLQHYTYFSMMRKCREKGIGWRLDMFVLSQRLYSRVKTCVIRDEIYGASDHVPIVLELEGTL